MKVFEIAKFNYSTEDKTLGEMFFVSKMKERKNFKYKKETKGNAKNGSYCPKKKFGQSWAYTKDNIEKENNKEDN